MNRIVVRDLVKEYPRRGWASILRLPVKHRALDGICFEVADGECLGIVGANGAGKTTLLRILAGSSFPTSGSVKVNGRLDAILDLGTGFHPDFTGLQNVRLAASIMGYEPAEIARRTDEICSFSGLGSFMETPVKFYSSGMFLRLAFSVATGFRPEILVVDEALAVGDAVFQRQSLERIEELLEGGACIVFCSHNLEQVSNLCSRALWIEEGRMRLLGPAPEVVHEYRLSQEASVGAEQAVCWIDRVWLDGHTHAYCPGDDLVLWVEATFTDEFDGEPAVGVAVMRDDGLCLYLTSSALEEVELTSLPGGGKRAGFRFPAASLSPGHYHFNVLLSDERNMQAYDIRERVARFEVAGSTETTGAVFASPPHNFSIEA